MDHLLLTRDPLDINAINELVSHESCGAVSFFIGTTRDNFDNKKVLSLEYEAYEPMAIQQLEAICEDIRIRWSDIFNIAIYHRLGLVAVREASVVIAISSPHRNSALNAVSYAIEELKRRAPIWKKELYDNNESTWKENKESGIKKLPKLDFSACSVQKNSVPHDLVQIAVEEEEIQHRIQSFVEKKRDEINSYNIMDFTDNISEIDNEMKETSSCARANTVVLKQENSKGHLRVKRVQNNYGPQTAPNYLRTLDRLMSTANNTTNIKQENLNTTSKYLPEPKRMCTPVNERLNNIDEYLNIPAMANIYDHIKAIENRILHLESISPEYKHFLKDGSAQITNAESMENCMNSDSRPFGTPGHKTYNVEELDEIIDKLRNEQNALKKVDGNFE